jgi:hypothetical protein
MPLTDDSHRSITFEISRRHLKSITIINYEKKHGLTDHFKVQCKHF